jgi:hypothetical protein
LEKMKKLLLLILLIPNLVMAEGMVFECRIQWDTKFHLDSGKPPGALVLFNTDPFDESYQYYIDQELLKKTSDGTMFVCEKNNWVLKCEGVILESENTFTETIEIGRKDLNYRFKRVSTTHKTGITSTDLKYYGKCKVLDENQF